MSYKTLLYQKHGRIARITLNRPRRLNAISIAVPREIRLAVEEANTDDFFSLWRSGKPIPRGKKGA